MTRQRKSVFWPPAAGPARAPRISGRCPLRRSFTDDGELARQKRRAVRARFDRKIADFVVCARDTLEIIALVELDDRTYLGNRRTGNATRSTKAVGYQTIRFQSKQKPSEAEIAALFSRSVALAAGKGPPPEPAQSIHRQS